MKIDCDYPTEHYLEDYEHRAPIKGAFRDMDFVKDRPGVEVQFGKYSFMVYNVCAKMTIARPTARGRLPSPAEWDIFFVALWFTPPTGSES